MRAPRGDIGPIWKPFGATWGGPPAPVSYAAASCFDCHEAFTFDMILAADASPKFVKLPPRRGEIRAVRTREGDIHEVRARLLSLRSAFTPVVFAPTNCWDILHPSRFCTRTASRYSRSPPMGNRPFYTRNAARTARNASFHAGAAPPNDSHNPQRGEKRPPMPSRYWYLAKETPRAPPWC